LSQPNEQNNKAKWDEVLALYEEGGSDVEACKILGVTQTKFDQLYADIPAFASLIDHGRTISKAWWYKMGRKALSDKGFNSTVYNFAMKNLYGWADKVQTTDTSATATDADALRTQFQALVARLEEKNPGIVRTIVAKAS
jgi:hypothetical protein